MFIVRENPTNWDKEPGCGSWSAVLHFPLPVSRQQQIKISFIFFTNVYIIGNHNDWYSHKKHTDFIVHYFQESHENSQVFYLSLRAAFDVWIVKFQESAELICFISHYTYTPVLWC